MRRGVMRFGLFLLAGAIVNVGVAWSISAWGPEKETWLISPLPLPLEDSPRFSFIQPDIRATGGPTFSKIGFFGDSLDRRSYVISRTTTIRLNDGSTRTSNVASITDEEFRAGWPLLSMRWRRVRADESILIHPADNGTRSWLVEGAPLSEGRDAPRLPMTPIPLGFAANTALYALVLWAPFGLFALVRRLRRVRRGACAGCGYDVREAREGVCPECGREIRSRESNEKGRYA